MIETIGTPTTSDEKVENLELVNFHYLGLETSEVKNRCVCSSLCNGVRLEERLTASTSGTCVLAPVAAWAGNDCGQPTRTRMTEIISTPTTAEEKVENLELQFSHYLGLETSEVKNRSVCISIWQRFSSGRKTGS